MKLIWATGDKIGWSPRNKPGQALLIQIVTILLLAIPVLAGISIVVMGSQAWEAVFGPDTRGGFIQLAYHVIAPWIMIAAGSFVGRVIQVGFSMPNMGMPRLGWRIAAVLIGVMVLGAVIASWSRVSELGAGTIDKPEKTVKFVEFDGKFGMGAIANPQQWAKTSDQSRADMENFKGAQVWWKGVVVDVRDGQVLIQMRQTSLENEVALVVGWWDQWKLENMHKGDLIEFAGVINDFGQPYPYAITNGSIISTRTATPDETKAALPGL